MVWLPDGEKKFEDMFSPSDRMSACDGQTDGRTDGHLATFTVKREEKLSRGTVPGGVCPGEMSGSHAIETGQTSCATLPVCWYQVPVRPSSYHTSDFWLLCQLHSSPVPGVSWSTGTLSRRLTRPRRRVNESRIHESSDATASMHRNFGTPYSKR